MNSVPVSAIFSSVEGEGIHVGKPTIFVRLSGCNLSCKWCDTDHSISYYATVEELKDKINELNTKTGIERIEFTGGEPLLYMNFLEELLSELPVKYDIAVQTNGTIAPGDDLFYRVPQWCVSPKLKSSGEAIVEDVVSWFVLWFRIKVRIAGGNRQDEFKFVINDVGDLLQLIDVVNRLEIFDAGVPMVIQPVYGKERQMLDNMKEIYKLTEQVEDVRVIPQCNKVMGMK